MARRAGKMRGDLRAMEIQQNDPRTNPVRGAGATPSMGLSQFRGGMTYRGGSECEESESDEELVGGNLGMERMVGSGRRGAAHHSHTSHKHQRMSEAMEMGHHLSRHLHSLHGAGWWDDFKSGFNSVMAPVAGVAKSVLPMLGPEGMAASGVIGALGYGHQGRRGARGRRMHHPSDIHGAGWWDDFKSGFNSVVAPVAGVAKSVLPMLGPEGMAASGVIGALGYGHHHGGAMYPSGAYEGQGREREDAMMSGVMGRGRKKRAPAGPNDGRRKRAEVVRRVMAEHGMKMIDASKYVKEHGLY